MIMNNIIQWFSGIVGQIVNLLPDAPIVSQGNFGAGVGAGTVCCAQVIIRTVVGLITTSNSSNGGGAASMPTVLSHSPIFLVVDPYWMGFFFGCFLSVAAAFFAVKTIIMIWQQVKW